MSFPYFMTHESNQYTGLRGVQRYLVWRAHLQWYIAVSPQGPMVSLRGLCFLQPPPRAPESPPSPPMESKLLWNKTWSIFKFFRIYSSSEKKPALIATTSATSRIIHPPEDISLVRLYSNQRNLLLKIFQILGGKKGQISQIRQSHAKRASVSS